jgi:hypothetical protein
LIPTFGPQLPRRESEWQIKEPLSEQVRAGFDVQVPIQGIAIALHRLGEPAIIEISHRSKNVSYFIEIALFLLVFFWGVMLWSKPLTYKVVWVVTLAVLSIAATGLLSAPNGRLPTVVVLALFFVVAIWIILGVLMWMRSLGKRVSEAAAAPRSTTTRPQGTRSPYTTKPSPSQSPAKTAPITPTSAPEAKEKPAEPAPSAPPPPGPAPESEGEYLKFPKIEPGPDKPEGGEPPAH